MGASRRRTACTHLTPAGRGLSAEAPVDDPPSAGAEVPGEPKGAAKSEAVEEAALPAAPLAAAIDVAGERGGDGDERAGVPRGLRATACPEAAATASGADEATEPAGQADAAAIGDDAATSVARSTVEGRDSSSP